MAIKTYGTMAVDWEQRIDFDRLRRERLDRAKMHNANLSEARMSSASAVGTDMSKTRSEEHTSELQSLA